MKSIGGIPREEFFKKMKGTGAISNANLRRAETLSPMMLVMAARAMPQYDPANLKYDSLDKLLDSDACWQVVAALRFQDYILNESRESYMLRIFLTKIIGQDYPEISEVYGLASEYENRRQLSTWQVEEFHKIIAEVLTSSERRILCYKLGLDGGGVRSTTDCAKILKTSPERAEALYSVALAKLTGDAKELKRQFGRFNYRRHVKKARTVRGDLKMIYRWLYVEDPFRIASEMMGVKDGS